MTEPQIYTKFKNWALVRKASDPSEARDWYNEYTSLFSEVDKAVNDISPEGIVIQVAASGDTPEDNGTALLAALVKAKASNPTEAKQVTIKLSAGTYDLGTDFLDWDTDYINIVGATPASRSQWVKKPLWTEVLRASSRIIGGNSNSVLRVSSAKCIFLNIDISGTATPEPLVLNCPVSASEGAAFKGCSIDGGVGAITAAQYIFNNCHSKSYFYGAGSAGGAGVLYHCSAAGGDSFYKVGLSGSTLLVDSCLINYTSMGSEAELDTVIFLDTTFYSSGLLLNQSSGGSDTVNTFFKGCTLNIGGYGTDSPGASVKANFTDCKITTSEALYLGAGSGLEHCKIDASGITANSILYLRDEQEGVTNCFIISGSSGDVINLGAAPPAGYTYSISGNVISSNASAGEGIAAGLPYSGGNVLNSSWIDTGSSPAETTTLQDAFNRGNEIDLGGYGAFIIKSLTETLSLSNPEGLWFNFNGNMFKVNTTVNDIDLEAARNLYLKDDNLSSKIAISDASNTELNTSNKTLVGSINELEARPAGEVNTASSEGTGEPLTMPKSGSNLPFKSIKAGANITLTGSATELEIAAAGGSSVAELNDIGDVNVPTPSDGDRVAWDSSTSRWTAQASSGNTILKKYECGVLGDYNNTPAFLKKVIVADTVTDIKPTSNPNNQFKNSAIDPYIVMGDQEIVSVHFIATGGSTSQSTVGTDPTVRLDVYEILETAENFLGTIRIPMTVGTAGTWSDNSQGWLKGSITLATPIAISNNMLLGFRWINENNVGGTAQSINNIRDPRAAIVAKVL